MSRVHVHNDEMEPVRYACNRAPELRRPLVICRLMEEGASRDDTCTRDLLMLKGDGHSPGLLAKCVYTHTTMGGVNKSHVEQHFAVLFCDDYHYMLVFPFWLTSLDVCEFLADAVGNNAFYCPWRPEKFVRATTSLWCASRCKHVEIRYSRYADHDPAAYTGYGKLVVRRTFELNNDALALWIDPTTRNLTDDDVVIQKRNIPEWRKRGLADVDDVDHDSNADDDQRNHTMNEIMQTPEGPRADVFFDKFTFAADVYERRSLPKSVLTRWVSAYVFAIGSQVFTVGRGHNIMPLCDMTAIEKMQFACEINDHNNKRRIVKVGKLLALHVPTYNGFDMNASAPMLHNGKINRWRGWEMGLDHEKLQGRQNPLHNYSFVTFMIEVAQRLFNSDLELMYIGLCYLRHAYLAPQVCPARMLLFRGVHGIGKGAFLDGFLGAHIFGKHHYHTVRDLKSVCGQFNASIVEACVVHIDDVKMTTHQYENLKSVITQTSGCIEYKGRDRIRVDHLVHHMVMSCNAVPFACDHSERRLVMVQCGDLLNNAMRNSDEAKWNAENSAFYVNCTEADEDFGHALAGAFMRFLVHHLDADRFDRTRNAPLTPLFMECADKSLDRNTYMWLRALKDVQHVDPDEAGALMQRSRIEQHPVTERDIGGAIRVVGVQSKDIPGDFEIEGRWYRRLPYKIFRGWINIQGNCLDIDVEWMRRFGLTTTHTCNKRMICTPPHDECVRIARGVYPTYDYSPRVDRPTPYWNEYPWLRHDHQLVKRPREEFVTKLQSWCKEETIDIDA